MVKILAGFLTRKNGFPEKSVPNSEIFQGDFWTKFAPPVPRLGAPSLALGRQRISIGAPIGRLGRLGRGQASQRSTLGTLGRAYWPPGRALGATGRAKIRSFPPFPASWLAKGAGEAPNARF